jgi:hypothetical protein
LPSDFHEPTTQKEHGAPIARRAVLGSTDTFYISLMDRPPQLRGKRIIAEA